MAWSNSKIFRSFLTDLLAQDVAHDLNASTIKAALYGNSGTPDQDAARAASLYNTGAWVVANEVSQAGQWAPGGVLLANPSVSNPASATVMFDADDTSSGAAATLASVHGALVYSDGITSPVADPGICFNYFGGAQSVTNGTFSIIWAANGVLRFTV